MRRKVATWSTLVSLALGAGAVAIASAGLAAALEPDLDNPQVVASGLTVPWGLDFLPDGSALTTERNSGRVLQLRPGSSPATVATITGVAAAGEGGLLGLAVSPTYAQDGFVYVYFTSASDNRIVRFRLDAPQNQQVVLSGLAKANTHNGGRIAFGPDGMLYAGVGDAGVPANAQNQQSRTGKILRLRPDGGCPPPVTRSRVRWSTASVTATCRAWPGTRPAGCTPRSSARTPGTRSTRSWRAATTAGRPSRGAAPTPGSATSTTAPAGACSVRWEVNDWSTGFTANVAVTNLGPARTSWTLSFTFGGDQRVSNAWNATVTQSGAEVTARNASWNGGLATGATVTFGLQGTYSGSNTRPSDFRLDGVACTAVNG